MIFVANTSLFCLVAFMRFIMVTPRPFAPRGRSEASWIYFANFPRTYGNLMGSGAACSSLHFGGLIIFQINEFFGVSVICGARCYSRIKPRKRTTMTTGRLLNEGYAFSEQSSPFHLALTLFSSSYFVVPRRLIFNQGHFPKYNQR